MLRNKFLKSALLGGAILIAGSALAQQDASQALLDLLVKKGLVTPQEAADLRAQAQANAAAQSNAAAQAPSTPPMPPGGMAPAPTAASPAPVVAVPSKYSSPLAFSIGSATFTPYGFLDMTGVYRSALDGGGIGSSFGSIPYSNTASAQLSETRFSVQNSRLGLKADSMIGDWKVLGLVETDFLGNAPTNINVASNSDVLRVRLYYADLRNGPWEFLAGQAWSLMTPNRKGLSPLPSDIFYTQDMDTNYQVGLIWGRTPSLRAIYHATDELTMGISAENPDQYVGGGVVLPSNFTATQVDQGANGTVTANTVPDMVGKIAYDTKFGDLPFHAELAGLYRRFEINTYVPASGLNADADANGYGGSFNMIANVAPSFELIENAFAAKGGGRYESTGLGPDFIVTPANASGVDQIRTVYTYADMFGAEWDATPMSKFYGYFGQVYYGKATAQQSNGSFVGYGYTGSSTSDNKLIEEYTLGLTQTLWKSPTAGDLKLLLQYSYLSRDPLYVAPNTPSNAHLNMFYFDFRYDLP